MYIEMIVKQEQCEYSKVAAGKGQQIVAGFAETGLQVSLKGNHAGHGGNDGAQSANIYAQEQRGVVFGVTGQQDRGRYVAQDLA